MPPIQSLSAFLLLLATTCLAETVSLRGSIKDRITALSTIRKPSTDYRFLPPISSDGADDNLQLLDIVLVASVDGKFHAFNRTSGHTLWSMSSTAPGTAPSTLGPLVRTDHANTDPDTTDENANQELYIIEPQSGDIYIMSSPSSPLQRLTFSMSQLVDMSPFSFSGDEDRRVFVGKKETSLLLVELETGKVKATLNSACPWDPFENLSETDPDDLDLDELEGTKPAKAKSTEVYIGRTDYHISIHTRPLSSSSPRPLVQNLSFSTYGPNNQDFALQTMYRRTPDDAYVQPLSNGEIFSFKTQGADHSESINIQDSQPLWGHTFKTPVVAVFDVLQAAGRQQPFVLLQPRPRLEDIAPTLNLPKPHLQNHDTAYVGLIEETGSLFAMTPKRFPLVVFGDMNMAYSQRYIDPPGGMDTELPTDIDSITRQRKLRKMCRNGVGDRKCLTGLRPLEDRSQLLDGAPSVALPPEMENAPVFETNPNESYGVNSSRFPPWIRGPANESTSPILALGASNNIFWATTSFILALTYGAVWWLAKRTTARKMSQLSLVNKSDIQKDSATVPDDMAISIQSPSSPGFITNPPLSALGTVSGLASPDLYPLSFQAEEKPIPETPSLQINLSLPVDPSDEGLDGEESEREGETNATPTKKKGPRRRRGRGGRGKKGSVSNEAGEGENKENQAPADPPLDEPKNNATIITLPPKPEMQHTPSLVISETVLGFGSHGTVVFQGSLQGRAVAVKRLLRDFVTLASREVSILQESDDHPHVIRYYYQEAHANFLYIALELCPASLADIIDNPDQFRDISISFNPKRALRQITSGLRHLHSLKIVHRDIKPQNILISSAKTGQGKAGSHRMLISDFGLCKKLDVDQTSFLPTGHGAMAAGTVGWRAPEILRGEVILDDATGDDHSQSSRGSVATTTGNGQTSGKPTRLTKSVDIFALGCLFYYTLTNGGHPFGDRFEREANIMKDAKCLNGLERFGEEGLEAVDLIDTMLHPEAYSRPDTTTCLLHPFFWDPGRRLNFLQDASDRFEIMCRDPRDANLVILEKDALSIVGSDWHSRLDKVFIENLGKFRKYDGKSVQDLLRALRNKKHHYQDLPDNVKRHLGPMPDGFLSYFTRRYPRLFLHVHSVVANTSLHEESMFKSYFELSD